MTATLFLSTRQVAALLGLSERTIRLWAESGAIPARKLGRQWRFRTADVEAWLVSSSDTQADGQWHPRYDRLHREQAPSVFKSAR